MHSDAKDLKEAGDKLFSDKRTLDTRNQEIAEHFYPERADFTVTKDIGDEWASHLMTGYPSLVRRDLGNALGAMLRPRAKQWFYMTGDEDQGQVVDHEADKWYEWATGVQRRAMYDPVTGFTRATKEGDHDFASFGGAVISCELNRRDVALLYRTWHLRDVVWREDAYGQISEIHRAWKPTVKELFYLFPKGDFHSNLRIALEKEPHRKVAVKHIIIRADAYDAGKRFNTPWVSLYMDCENSHIIEEKGSWSRVYVIPRWATISGSQYPYSPATLIALPDARLIQAMTYTLLQAGEKAVDPPMIGVGDAIRGDLDIRAGGFTSVDVDYDERLGEVLRPLSIDKNGLPFGLEVFDRTSMMLKEAFYLNTLTLPPHGGPDMTAYEVGQRVQEYIRQALPLFEPMEHDYNGALCEITFETLLRNGAFGSLDMIPRGVGPEVKFKFESPLADMIEREKGQTFLESKAMIAEALALDEDAAMVMDFSSTLRDVLDGIGAPAKWLNSPDDVAAMKAQKQNQMAQAQMLAQLQQGADVANKLGVQADQFGGV